jgi:hypothetical protein
VDIAIFDKNTCFLGNRKDPQADINKSELEECSIGRGERVSRKENSF